MADRKLEGVGSRDLDRLGGGLGLDPCSLVQDRLDTEAGNGDTLSSCSFKFVFNFESAESRIRFLATLLIWLPVIWSIIMSLTSSPLVGDKDS